ncbi:hypothetical protein P8452_14405 [Trifolium repens]|nr:hypothetical protein P8452_14405 [Trifolium repens]
MALIGYFFQLVRNIRDYKFCKTRAHHKENEYLYYTRWHNVVDFFLIKGTSTYKEEKGTYKNNSMQDLEAANITLGIS